MLLALVLSLPLAGQGESSNIASEIQQLNRSIAIRSEKEGRAYNSEKLDKTTNEIRRLLGRYVLLSIQRQSFSADALRNQLSALQADLKLPPDLTNTPIVSAGKLGNQETIAVGVLLVAGGLGSPNTRPSVEFFARGKGGDRRVASWGKVFNDHGLFVVPVRSRHKNELWYFVYGTRIGDNHRRLRAELIAFDGKTVASRWKSESLFAGEVALHPDSIELHYLDETRYAKSQPPYFVVKQLGFTPNGLTEVPSTPRK